MGSSLAGEEEQPLTLVSTLPSGHSPQGPSSLTAQEWAAGCAQVAVGGAEVLLELQTQ